MSAVIVWFRQDLRLADHPALTHAASLGIPVIPLYIWCPEEEGAWKLGGASKFYLHQSLESLDRDLHEIGSRLIIREGKAEEVIKEVLQETDAKNVVWSRRYEPASVERDKRLRRILTDMDVEVQSFNSALMHEPWRIKTKDERPYKVFTAYWRACSQMPEIDAPTPPPKVLKHPSKWPKTLKLANLHLEPTIKWAEGIRESWNFGEEGAKKTLEQFIKSGATAYTSERNRPDHQGVSRMSPHLHFGEISVRSVWHRVSKEAAKGTKSASAQNSYQTYLKELGWREFAHHVMFNFPETPNSPLDQRFENFPWVHNKKMLEQWQAGETGYPLVDAGMRELWHTGWMHNRVRMVVASFLVKDLLEPWLTGAKWFWDTLVDADLANNTLGWQWCAGCGADAAPYFRIFNPTLQAHKFDPDGDYVRTWVPELAKLEGNLIHEPWNLSESELSSAGIKLGKSYPKPLVDHKEARQKALAALKDSKKG